MRKLADSIYLENIAEVKTILENEHNIIEEKIHQLALVPVDAAYQGKLAHTLQLAIAVNIDNLSL